MKETVSDGLWMSALAGAGGVVIEGIIVGSLYLFDPVAKMMLESESSPVLISFVCVFLAGFGISLQFTLGMQFRRGKWK